MRIQAVEVRAVAAENGFEARNMEKTARRLSLLTAMSRHGFLQDRFALKDGTALHLFVMDMDRLSIDIDIHYTGAGGIDEYPQFVAAMRDVFAREGLLVNRKSLPKPTRDVLVCRAGYMRVADELARRDLVTVDVDFQPNALLAVPVRRASRRLGAWQARNVPLADTYEIMAGKMAALLDRGKARDLYGVSLLQRADWLDFPRLQDVFLTMEARRGLDRRRSAPILSFDSAEIRTYLLPLLRKDVDGATDAEIDALGRRWQSACQAFGDRLLTFPE